MITAGESKLHATKQSRLYQRLGGQPTGDGWWDTIGIHVLGSTAIPPTSPPRPDEALYLAQLAQVPWSIFPLHEPNGPHTRSYWTTYPGGTIERDIFLDTGFISHLQSHVHPGQSFWGPVTNFGNGQYSLWYWQLTDVPGDPNVWRQNLFATHTRYRWTNYGNSPPTGFDFGFTASADLWVVTEEQFGWSRGAPGLPWPNGDWPDGFSFDLITGLNIHLLSERSNTPPTRWIDSVLQWTTPPGEPHPGTYTQGFIGRMVFSVDGETPDQWTARTGLPIG